MPPIRNDQTKKENGLAGVSLLGNTSRDRSSPTEPDLTRTSIFENPPDAQSLPGLPDLPDPLQACTILRQLGWVNDAKELLGAYTRYKHYMELFATGELQKLEPRTTSQEDDLGQKQQRSYPYPAPQKNSPSQIRSFRNPRSPRRYPPVRFSPYPQALPQARSTTTTHHQVETTPAPQLVPIADPRLSSSANILHEIRTYLRGTFTLDATSSRQYISVSRHGAYLRWSHPQIANPCIDALDAAMRVSCTWITPVRRINSGMFIEGIILRLAARKRYKLCCAVCSAPQHCHTNFFKMEERRLEDVTQSLLRCLNGECPWVLQDLHAGGAQRYTPATWRLQPRVAARLEGVCRRVLRE